MNINVSVLAGSLFGITHAYVAQILSEQHEIGSTVGQMIELTNIPYEDLTCALADLVRVGLISVDSNVVDTALWTIKDVSNILKVCPSNFLEILNQRMKLALGGKSIRSRKRMKGVLKRVTRRTKGTNTKIKSYYIKR